MIDVTVFSALVGGILTFFAPCTLPLIPGYIAFIGGPAGGRNQQAGNDAIVPMGLRQHIMLNALLFVLGFSLVFIAFGIVSGSIGQFLILYRKQIAEVGGLVVIFLGLSMLDFSAFPRLTRG